MSESKKPLTKAQKRALKEIEWGCVFYDKMEHRFRSTEFPPRVRTDTVERILAAKLATIEGAFVILTDAGRQALKGGPDGNE